MSTYVMIDRHTFPEADFRQEKEIIGNSGNRCVLAECKTPDEVAAAAAGAEVMGVNLFRVDAALLDRLPRLKAIVRYGIGYDVVDVDACTARGVMLVNMPTYCVTDVAVHTLALLLDVNRKVTMYDREARQGRWDVSHGYPIRRFESLTAGLLGFGNIARVFAGYVRALGMKAAAYDPFVADEVFRQHGVAKMDLDQLLARADVVSVHVPNIPATRHLIRAETIAKMKDGVMILNTSRGAIIALDDLVAALRSGKVAAAGLDVFEGEPITDLSHPMYQCETLVITPHMAYISVESSAVQHTEAAQAAVAVFRGDIPPNVVNKMVLDKRKK